MVGPVGRTELDWDPPFVAVTDLKPGDVHTTTFTFTNTTGVPVVLDGVAVDSGTIFDGATPLSIQVAITISPEDACVLDPDAVPPGGTATATMVATLPALAGNEYQGTSGSATLRVRATESSVCTSAPTRLASTGLDVLGPVLLGVALVALGILARRKAWHRRGGT